MKRSRGGLVDLLDRMLDRGVYLRADLVITVAGVPLLGLNLRAALGAIDTLVEYGVFEHDDTLVRSLPLLVPIGSARPAAVRSSQ